MVKEKKPEVDEQVLNQEAERDPTSKKWNNPNSRKNLKQYQDEDQPAALVPVVESDTDDDRASQQQAEAITVGRKLDTKLVKKLIPKRGTLTLDEHKRFTDIATSFLSDFKNEEPTASDIDDIFEIAMCTIQDTRLLAAAKGDDGRADASALISISKASESLNKRKQKAKENLASRRSDRKSASMGQDVNIVDLAARYDNKRRQLEMDRVQELLKEEGKTKQQLRDIVEGEIF